jgi:hypothetical protein
MIPATKARQQAALHLATLERTRSADGTIRALSALLEDPILARDVEARELRHNAMVELLALRGLDAEAILP